MFFSKTFWLPVMTLWQRELIRFWREKGRVLGFVGSPLIFWLVIGSGFGDLRFFFPGALILTVMFSAVFSTMSLIEDRREGFLLSMLVSPAPRSSMAVRIISRITARWQSRDCLRLEMSTRCTGRRARIVRRRACAVGISLTEESRCSTLGST